MAAQRRLASSRSTGSQKCGTLAFPTTGTGQVFKNKTEHEAPAGGSV